MIAYENNLSIPSKLEEMSVKAKEEWRHTARLLLCGNYIAQGQNTTDAPKMAKHFYIIKISYSIPNLNLCVCVREKTKDKD